jgi:threonine/homoserine/homoserine lactone efflux protein
MGAVFLSSVALAFSGAVMPGPLLTLTIRKALEIGPKSGFLLIFGHALLELALVVLIFLGFDIALKSNVAQIAIGLVGGALLALMGADMVISAARNKLKIELQGKSGTKNLVLSGALISAMNPYFLIWWAIIGLSFLLSAYQLYGVAGVAAFYFGHITTDFLWYGGISTLIGKTRKFINQNVYRVLVGMLGLVLLYFGVTFLINAITRF